MIGEIVKQHLDKNGWTIRKSADQINDQLPAGHGISFQAIDLWKRNLRVPDYFFVRYMVDHATGPAQQMFVDILEALE